METWHYGENTLDERSMQRIIFLIYSQKHTIFEALPGFWVNKGICHFIFREHGNIGKYFKGTRKQTERASYLPEEL